MKTKLTKCTTCHQSIAKSATKCSHYGHTSTSIARMGLIALIVILIMFLLGGGAIMEVLTKDRHMEAIQAR